MKNYLKQKGAVWGSVAASILYAGQIFAAPANDNFASARVISGGLPFSVTGSNVGATAQSGEPNHSDAQPMSYSGRKSIWFTWTAPFTGNLLLTTEGSGSQEAQVATTDPYVDTQVGVYTGTSVSALTTVVKKEDSDGYYKHGWTRIAFNVVSGRTYRIAVDGWRGAQGRIKLNFKNNGGARYKLSALSNPSGTGTFAYSPARPVDGYPSGTTVSVTTYPTGTNKFFGWLGVGGSSTNPLSVKMTAAKTITALFNTTRQIAMQNTNGSITEWVFNGTTYQGATSLRNGFPAGSGWRLAGSGNFNSDGKPDLVFQHTDTRVAVWYMDRLSYKGVVTLAGGTGTGTGWRVAAVGRMNTDATSDLILQHTDGRVMIWLMSGTSRLQALAPRAATGLRAFAAADVNGDGKTDILFHATSGKCVAWIMNLTTYVSTVNLAGGAALDSSWQAVGAADFNKDRKNDVIWQNKNGTIGVWYLNGTTLLQSGTLRSGTSAGTAKVRAVY